MPAWIVSDELWARIEPLLPVVPRRRDHPGRKRLAWPVLYWANHHQIHLHESLLAELHVAGALDWSRAVIDGSHVRAMKGGPKRGRARSIVPGPARSTT